MQSDYLRNKKIRTLLKFRKQPMETKPIPPMSSNDYTIFLLYDNANRPVDKETKNQLVGPGMLRVFDCEMADCSNVNYCNISHITTNMPFRGYKQYLSTNEYKIKSKNSIAGYPKVHNITCIVKDISCAQVKELKAFYESQNIWEEDVTYIVG